jgi:hypothetical protein
MNSDIVNPWNAKSLTMPTTTSTSTSTTGSNGSFNNVMPLKETSTHPLRHDESTTSSTGSNCKSRRISNGRNRNNYKYNRNDESEAEANVIHHIHPYRNPMAGDLAMEDIHVHNRVDHHVDVLQTYNTALCYLCSINADVTEIETYLRHYPQSLLMENICLLNEDSATYILQQHSKLCRCQSLHCHLNRIRVVDLIERGYIYFRRQLLPLVQQQQQSSPTLSSNPTTTGSTSDASTSANTTRIPATGRTISVTVTPLSSNHAPKSDRILDHTTITYNIDSSNTYFATLVQIEHNIRQWRIQELTIRNTMIELSILLRTYHIEMKRCRRAQPPPPPPPPQWNDVISGKQKLLLQQHPVSALSLLTACTIGRRHLKKDDNDDDDDDDDDIHEDGRNGNNHDHHRNERKSNRDASVRVAELPYSRNNQNSIPVTNDRISVLQDHIRDTHQQLQLVQEQHYQFIQNIRNGRREQFNILKHHIFQNCVRHDICSMMMMPIQSPTATANPTPSIATTSDTLYLQGQQERKVQASHKTSTTTKSSKSLILPPMGEVTVDVSFDNATAYSI